MFFNRERGPTAGGGEQEKNILAVAGSDSRGSVSRTY
jgi:hypothetical protein